jgi:hypothetical protein
MLLVAAGAVQAQPAYEFPDYFKASNTDSGDEFGKAVAADGDTLVIAAPFESSAAIGVDGDEQDNTAETAGAVYVFVRDSNGAWTQQAYLKPSNTGRFDRFGTSVAISGDTIVVGAEAEDSSASGVGGDQEDNLSNGAGAAYVFVRSDGVWEQQAYLKASNPDAMDQFGAAVAIDGDTIVVGADGEDSFASGVNGNSFDNTVENSGAAYVFVRTGTSWTQQAYLKASNTDSDDQFGSAVAVHGDRIAVGSGLEDSGATGVGGDETDNSAEESGAVYLFERAGTTWSQVAYLKASNTDALDRFGSAVSLEGDTLVVGALGEDGVSTGLNGDPLDNSGAGAGAAYVFEFDGVAWTQQSYVKASNTDNYLGRFGVSVQLHADRMIIGGTTDDSGTVGVDGNQDDQSASYSGAAFVFERSGSSWQQIAYLKASNTEGVDYLGSSVAITDQFAVAAAHWEDGSAIGINGNADDNSADAAGAVYVYSAVPSFSIGGVVSGLAGSELELQLNGQEALVLSADGGFAFDGRFGDGEAYAVEIIAQPVAPPQFCRLTNASGVVAGANVVDIQVSCDPPAPVPGFTLEEYIKASNTDQGDRFGFSLAIDRDTLVVGAPSEASAITGIGGSQNDNSAFGAGAVYVYLRDASGAWAFDRYIKSSNTDAADNFGAAVALSGDILAVGAPGEDSAATGFNGDQFDDSRPDAGAVYIYVRDGTGGWFPQAYLKASNTDAGDRFGASVGLSGETLIVGAPNEDSSGVGVGSNQVDNASPDAGAAYVFTRAGVTWSQQAYLKPLNTDAEDLFGNAVDIDGDRLIVASPAEDGGDDGGGNGQPTAGAAYVFERVGTDWSQVAYLKADAPDAGDFFGHDVAIDGRLAVVGARLDDGPANALENSGAAYVFERLDEGWALDQALYAANADADDRLGWAVDIDAGEVLVTARAEASAALGVDGNPDDNSLPFAGAAYLFRRNLTQWQQAHYIKGFITDEQDFFGEAAGVSAGLIAVGAINEDSNAQGIGGDATNNSALSSGAVYTYATDTFAVGGSVTGLVGSGLSLRLNGKELLEVSANGTFEFDQALLGGALYEVEIATLPDSPPQACQLSNGIGYVLDQDVTSIQVDCSSAYRVGGTVSGVAGPGLVLRNNGGDDLPITSNGIFIFPTRVASGQAYEVTIASTPSNPNQRCLVSNGSGVVQGQNVTSVIVQCQTVYAIAGTVSGLAGGTLVLQNNGGNRLPIDQDGAFEFSQALPAGADYAVAVRRNPQLPPQLCQVNNGEGTVQNAAVTDIQVTCVSGYRIGGTVSGVDGLGVLLANNDGPPLPIIDNGPFQFSRFVPNGSSYDVTIEATSTMPPQTCDITNGRGTVQGADIDDIEVVCETGYRLGGQVTGLQGSGLVLANAGGDTLAIAGNGSFVFAERLSPGTGYSVTVESGPTSPEQLCEVSNGSGDVTDADVTDILVECAPPQGDAGQIQFTLAAVTVVESDGVIELALERLAGSAGEVVVRVLSQAGSAQAGEDFQALDVQRTWPDGETSNRTIAIELTDDALEEPVEQFTLQIEILSGGAALGANSELTVTVEDDDGGLFADRFEAP